MTNLWFFLLPIVSAKLYTVVWIIPFCLLVWPCFMFCCSINLVLLQTARVESTIVFVRICEIFGQAGNLSWIARSFSKFSAVACNMRHFMIFMQQIYRYIYIYTYSHPMFQETTLDPWQVCSSRGALPKRPWSRVENTGHFAWLFCSKMTLPNYFSYIYIYCIYIYIYVCIYMYIVYIHIIYIYIHILNTCMGNPWCIW